MLPNCNIKKAPRFESKVEETVEHSREKKCQVYTVKMARGGVSCIT